jgi:hypothetical protein
MAAGHWDSVEALAAACVQGDFNHDKDCTFEARPCRRPQRCCSCDADVGPHTWQRSERDVADHAEFVAISKAGVGRIDD